MTVNFEKIDKALSRLKDATTKKTVSDLERDGAIQRFEYTVELLWKMGKKVLAENGIEATVPKDVIRELASAGWIHDPEELLEFLRMRNESSHSYKEEVAKEVFEAAKNFASSCKKSLKY